MAKGPADGRLSRCSFGAVLGTAQKYGRASRCTKSGAGRLSRIVSVCPAARHERTSRRYASAGDTSSGERARSKLRANDAAALQLPAGKATPAPPVGTALGPHGINIVEFTKTYNERTADKAGQVIPAQITIFEDRSFTFVLKTPPAADLLRKAAGIDKGSRDGEARDRRAA